MGALNNRLDGTNREIGLFVGDWRRVGTRRRVDTRPTPIFENDHRATGALVVGADGTHSIIRNAVLGHPTTRRYAGYVNWNGLVAVDEALAPKNSWVIYAGDALRASLMPVGGDRFYVFLDVPLPESEAKTDAPRSIREELSQRFAGWAEPVQRLIQQLDPAKTNRVPIHDIEPLPKLVNGRIALLGDAGHSTTPDLGQGGCQEIEDAWVLATMLLTTNLSVADALQRYETARSDRTAEIILKARKRADMIHGKDRAVTQQWYDDLAQEDGSNIMKAIGNIILKGPLL